MASSNSTKTEHCSTCRPGPKTPRSLKGQPVTDKSSAEDSRVASGRGRGGTPHRPCGPGEPPASRARSGSGDRRRSALPRHRAPLRQRRAQSRASSRSPVSGPRTGDAGRTVNARRTQSSRRDNKLSRTERFRFKRTDSIGAAAAEDDGEVLKDCYVDTGALQLLQDIGDRRRIVLGRTGTGKSALLAILEQSQPERAIKLSPEHLALTYVANSTILNFFGSIGVNLDPFFKLLWRHVPDCRDSDASF